MVRERWKLEKYKQNLRVDEYNIYSYDTRVAKIDHNDKMVYCLGYWSRTTSKHINYVAREYNYTIINGEG